MDNPLLVGEMDGAGERFDQPYRRLNRLRWSIRGRRRRCIRTASGETG